jgi:uncharacterized protein (DUF2249 family)
MNKTGYALLVTAIFALSTVAQQVADTAFLPVIENPTYTTGEGPVVLVDEAHYNFHTASARYLPFAELLRRDGYVVQPNTTPFEPESLGGAEVLVISNALNERNAEEWSLPTPSAFAPREIEAVRQWVESGGALFLIADHMPFPGAASDLATVFGIDFNNGFAVDTLARGPAIFRRSDTTLLGHEVTDKSEGMGRIDSVATFTGQAFRSDSPAFQPLLVFDSGYISLMPDTAWVFTDSTKIISVKGWYQGGVLSYGQGRVAVFGEAAMFTAQTVGDEQKRFGMNSDVAEQNLQFLMNIMRWLAGKI